MRKSILDWPNGRRDVLDYRSAAVPLTTLGLVGAISTAILGFLWAPLVNPDAWNAPEAYRILYWHVPFAWTSFLAFCLLLAGSISWFIIRSEKGWGIFVIGSELGLLFGAGVVISGPIGGSAEWGVPWDWGDARLNTYALLTAMSLFLVSSFRSQPEGQDTRDSLSAIGILGCLVLVPITVFATTLWQDRHPGVVVIESEDSGLQPEILLVLMLGTISFFVLFSGLVALNLAIMDARSEIEEYRLSTDRGAL